MKNENFAPVSILLLIFIVMGCSSPNVVKQGNVIPSEFYAETTFTTAKTLILIPFSFEGEIKNFLFDTGATVTTVQRDSIFGDIVEVRGAANKIVKNGSETIPSMKFEEVDFIGTFATNENMIDLNEQIPIFGGVLGRTIIDKANWLIHYPERTVAISDKDLSDETYSDIELDPSFSAPITWLEIEGNKHKCIIDLGSVSIFNVPDDTELAQQLLDKYPFAERQRERYTVGGTELITELIGVVPRIKLGEVEFENVEVNINQSSQIRVGMSLFTECMIYIDNDRGRYRVKQLDRSID